jgi:hypothetical protein
MPSLPLGLTRHPWLSLPISASEQLYHRTLDQSMETVFKVIVPDWEDKVDCAIGLSYRPASLCSLTGRYDNPMHSHISQLYPPSQGL